MHSAQQMFELINDVESYPQFLPWCASSKLLSQNEQQLCGEMEVSRMGIHQHFSTCNTLFPFERIDISLNEGPFKNLSGSWIFHALREDACKVELELEFEFSGKLINAAFGAVFRQIADTMVDSFCTRANEIYP